MSTSTISQWLEAEFDLESIPGVNFIYGILEAAYSISDLDERRSMLKKVFDNISGFDLGEEELNSISSGRIPTEN